MLNTDLLSLAERVAAATGPDRELDAAIYEAVTQAIGHSVVRDSGQFRVQKKSDDYFFTVSVDWVQAYTASIDAAMTLVPEGWHLTRSGEGRFLTNGRFVATLETWAIETDEEGEEVHTTPARYHAVAETFPLALCAAALRAIAAQSEVSK